MKHRLLGLAVGILTFVVGWSIPFGILKPRNEQVLTLQFVDTPASAWELLLSLENRDLRKFDALTTTQVQMAIDKLVGRSQNQFPRLFSKLSTNQEEQRYILIEESPLVTVPGESRLRLSLFTENGILLSSSEFSAGWRIVLSEIRLIQVKGIEGDVLEVESYPMINGADVAKQYYAPVADEMRLIRLEDSSGALISNIYRTPNHTIGFTPIGRSADDWEKALESKDVTEVLAALTWLGGVHLNVDGVGDGQPASWHEYVSEANLVETVRGRSAVKASLERLKHSDNRWIREAAKAAALTLTL